MKLKRLSVWNQTITMEFKFYWIFAWSPFLQSWPKSWELSFSPFPPAFGLYAHLAVLVELFRRRIQLTEQWLVPIAFGRDIPHLLMIPLSENSGVPAACLGRFPSAILGIDLFTSLSELLNAGALNDQLLKKKSVHILKNSRWCGKHVWILKASFATWYSWKNVYLNLTIKSPVFWNFFL